MVEFKVDTLKFGTDMRWVLECGHCLHSCEDIPIEFLLKRGFAFALTLNAKLVNRFLRSAEYRTKLERIVDGHGLEHLADLRLLHANGTFDDLSAFWLSDRTPIWLPEQKDFSFIIREYSEYCDLSVLLDVFHWWYFRFYLYQCELQIKLCTWPRLTTAADKRTRARGGVTWTLLAGSTFLWTPTSFSEICVDILRVAWDTTFIRS